MRESKVNAELNALRTEGRQLIRRRDMAVRVLDAALVNYGGSRHPLLDSLLDMRNLLRPNP